MIIMNILTNFALYKRFNPIWDNRATVPLFAAFTFPSSSTANVLTWYSSMYLGNNDVLKAIFQI